MESEFQAAAEQAARAGGEVLRKWAEKFTVSEKGHADLVTEADMASQAAIFDMLHARFPEHGFLGEEGLTMAARDSEYRWVIDPLDGTTNYVHRFPYYAVSIGLESAGEVVAGAIYDPTRDELFSAARGQGASVNGQALRPSRFDRLSKAMVIASFPPGVTVDSPAIKRFLNVLPHAQTIHRSGSSALNMAYVAAGRLDGYWSTSLKAWDMAAGILLVREAGGRVTRTNGAKINIDVPDLLCTNGTSIHEELQALLKVDESA